MPRPSHGASATTAARPSGTTTAGTRPIRSGTSHHPFAARAEQPVRHDHQHRDKDAEDHQVLVASPDVAVGVLLNEADGERTDRGPDDAAVAAERQGHEA